MRKFIVGILLLAASMDCGGFDDKIETNRVWC